MNIQKHTEYIQNRGMRHTKYIKSIHITYQVILIGACAWGLGTVRIQQRAIQVQQGAYSK